MGITPQFTKEDVKKRFDEFADVVKEEEIKMLLLLGEKCVIHARNLGKDVGYEDQTGNLRSSTGFTVFDHGESVHEFYDQVKDGSEGSKTGKELALKIGEQNKDTICLVVVAGMDYALFLEANGAFKVKSKRGYDVLASAEHLAQQELPKMVADLIKDIKEA